MMARLVIFDVDGTLARKYTLNLLPGVEDFFRLVELGGCSVQLKMAIATNQGGVGLRYWMEREHFGHPQGYPTATKIDERLHALVEKLGAGDSLPVYVSFRYRDREGNWSPIPPGSEENPRWRTDWRKPAPGMLLQAMQDAGVSSDETLFVGDSTDDQGAASAAGCAFQPADAFFQQDWKECSALDKLAEKF